MIKKRFRLIFILCLIFVLSSSTISLAETQNVNVSTTPPGSTHTGGVTTNDVFPPSSTINLMDEGRLDFSGWADNTSLYTNKAFKGVTQIRLVVTNNDSSTLTVKLHQDNFLGSTVIATYTVQSTYTLYTFPSNLNSSKSYFLEFVNPCDFEGYIEPVS